MSSKRSKKSPINIELSAKAEAKLNLHGEVPSSSIGRLVDSLTDIIRPFSESRGLKADLLRMQRDDVAYEIAKRARLRIAEEGLVPHPVPNKILVPLLESGSCEGAEDDLMIERWANLLASAAVEQKVHPRFIGILRELGGSQAACLERVAFNCATDLQYPNQSLEDSSFIFAEHHVQSECQSYLRRNLKAPEHAAAVLDEIVRTFSRPGAFF